MKNEKASKSLYILSGILLTAVGFVTIPPLLKKYSKSLYKKAIQNTMINFEQLGPEIIKKKNAGDK